MPKLKITIANEDSELIGQYEIDYSDCPGLDTARYFSTNTIDIIRAATERHRYITDFIDPPTFSLMSFSFEPDDTARARNLYNVNELWLEVQNILLGAQLNFATARILKELEDGRGSSSHELNARRDLHLDKMERFNLGVYELARVEDMIVRLVYEFFGAGFIEVDLNRPDWERLLTWRNMVKALKKKGKPEEQPHPPIEAMSEVEHTKLMNVIREYRSQKLLDLTDYRNRRAHRVAPTVDHAELGVVMQSASDPVWRGARPLFIASNRPEFDFLELYAKAKDVYAHLISVLIKLNSIVHA